MTKHSISKEFLCTCINWVLILCISLSIFACQTNDSGSEVQELNVLLDKKEFFKLASSLSQFANEMSKKDRLYFQAFVDNAFNRNSSSNKIIEDLFNNYLSELSDSMKVRLLMIQQDNDFKTFRYASAAETGKKLAGYYPSMLPKDIYDDIKNKTLIYDGLSSIPAQEVSIPGNTVVRWQKDKMGLIEIPLKMRDSIVAGIFDTRANISSITDSYARKLGVKKLGVTYTEGSGITGNLFKVSLGIADSLWIGPILLQHVVFQVMPDEVLYIAPIDFHMNLILGYPAIAALREIHILKNGSFRVPANPTLSELRNMAMDELNPVVSCMIGKDSLIFEFDTGASTSDFFDSYFRRFKDEVRRDGKPDSVMMGGAGGIVTQRVFVLKDIPLLIGSKTAILKKVEVHEDSIPNTHYKFYGNLGQDVMEQFDEMILNFESMYIEFR
ncbi:MAG: aspartyl protease family protein [Chitinophagales bacterium]